MTKVSEWATEAAKNLYESIVGLQERRLVEIKLALALDAVRVRQKIRMEKLQAVADEAEAVIGYPTIRGNGCASGIWLPKSLLVRFAGLQLALESLAALDMGEESALAFGPERK